MVGATLADGGTAANKIRGISKKNPKLDEYLEAATKEFGDTDAS